MKKILLIIALLSAVTFLIFVNPWSKKDAPKKAITQSQKPKEQKEQKAVKKTSRSQKVSTKPKTKETALAADCVKKCTKDSEKTKKQESSSPAKGGLFKPRYSDYLEKE
ncbi:MAG: hypothetical protein GY754_27165 [bacterium]|nr:hypothetical protein [bacterium]